MMLARQEIGCWEDQDLNDWSNKQCHIMNETVNRWSTLWTVYFLSFFAEQENCSSLCGTAADGTRLPGWWWWYIYYTVTYIYSDMFHVFYLYQRSNCDCVLDAAADGCCNSHQTIFSDYLQVDSWEILCWKLCQVFSKVEKCTSSVIESISVVQ